MSYNITEINTYKLDLANPIKLRQDLTLADKKEELQKTLRTRQIYRTEIEMRVGVLQGADFPTKSAKYWQCVREQAGMLQILAYTSIELRKTELDIKRILRKLENIQLDELDKEELIIELDQLAIKKSIAEDEMADRIREIRLWSDLKQELDDGSFDTENINSSQLIDITTRIGIQLTNLNLNTVDSHEANNLFGQLNSAVELCRKNNVLDKVLNLLPTQLHNFIQLENKNGS
jgi:hypothetical protein